MTNEEHTVKRIPGLKISLIDYMGSDHSIEDDGYTHLGRWVLKQSDIIQLLLLSNILEPFYNSSDISIEFRAPIFVRDEIQTYLGTVKGGLKIERPNSFDFSSLNKIFYIPSNNYETDYRLTDLYLKTYYTYLYMLESGIDKKIAFSILPQSTYVTFYANGSLLEWVTLYKELKELKKDNIYKDVANIIYKIVLDLFPESWVALVEHEGALYF